MSFCHGSVSQEVRPGTARVLVTELSGSGQINPTPATKPCESTVNHSYLSPEKLELLCGTRDLSHVTLLEICVDTQENTLGNFGVYLPRLVQLRMNNSVIMSVRDLGTALSHLQVLWMPHCSLQDLDGISTFSSLKELYLAYNSVSDLSQVGMLENLQFLDLEGNNVDDLVQVQYLGLCDKLQTLSLEGNPVCARPNPTAIQTADYSYRAAVRELVPQLHYLDDVRVEEDGCDCSSTMGDDWVILQNAIRDGNFSQAATEDGSRPHTDSRPMTATGPGVLSPPGSRPASADSDLATIVAESSILTHGAGKVLFCGNPVQALRARREKLRTAPTRSSFTPRDPPIHMPEHTYDLEEPDVRERVDVFAELRAWREEHSRRLQAIENERLPQVLAIQQSDEDKGKDYDEEVDFGDVGTDSSDDEHGEAKQRDSQDTASPDSSFQSLSPDFHLKEVQSPDMAQLSWSPEPVHCPSPPVRPTAASGYRKLPGIRERRLRLSQTNSDHLPDFSGNGRSLKTGKTSGDTDLTLQQVQQLTRTNVPLFSLPVHIPHPPSTSTLGDGLMDSCAHMDFPNIQSGKKHHQTPQTSKPLDSPVVTRPHTARAALQKHHPHHML